MANSVLKHDAPASTSKRRERVEDPLLTHGSNDEPTKMDLSPPSTDDVGDPSPGADRARRTKAAIYRVVLSCDLDHSRP